MKTLTIGSETLQALKIIRTETDIIGTDGKNELWAFRGVNDFDAFVIDGEWDVDEMTELKQQVASMTIELDELKAKEVAI